MKRVLITSDTHCGNQYGLTPPDWYSKGPEHKELQRKMWEWYKAEMDLIGPVDIHVSNGDAVDGEGKKENSEHITTDTEEQAEIAIQALSVITAKNRIFTYGTPYHANGTQPYENMVANYFNAPISADAYFEVNGVKFHARHHGGRSDTPYGQGTQISKEATRDALHASITNEPQAQILIRSHVHYYYMIENGTHAAFSTPCYQYPLGMYGHRLRTMYYNVGHLLIEIDEDSNWFRHSRIMPMSLYKRRDYVKY